MITLTEIAANKVKEIAKAEGLEGQGLRLQVKGGGCSGFQYDLYFDEKPTDMDQIVECLGIQLFVDPLSIQYLENTEIDYVESLSGAGFKFGNPNVKGTCGCGSSFLGVILRAALAAALFLLLATGDALANGRFPNAQEFHQGPAGNRELMVLRATFGLVVSVDGGRRWEYWCEDALQYGDNYDPPLIYTADGTLLVALDDGLVTTRNGCTFRRQPDLESLTIRDLAASPDGRTAWAIALTRNATPDSRVARSTDNGLTFEFVGERFVGVSLQTIEVAASDPMRLYASGVSAGAPVLFRSVDGGAHWVRAAGRFGGATGLYVSGVDGRNADVVYLRATAAPEDMDAGSVDGSGVLFRSDDGGETVRAVLRTNGPMRGFAISDDGQRVWAGGPDDGVWRIADGAAPTRLTDTPVECLRWSDGALWACRTYVPGGALLLRGDGDGAFATVLEASAIGGPPARCPVGTLSRDVCPGRWSVVQRTLGRADAGLDAATDGAAVVAPPPADGCGCRVGPSRGGAAWVLGALSVLLRRRARRPSGRR